MSSAPDRPLSRQPLRRGEALTRTVRKVQFRQVNDETRLSLTGTEEPSIFTFRCPEMMNESNQTKTRQESSLLLSCRRLCRFANMVEPVGPKMASSLKSQRGHRDRPQSSLRALSWRENVSDAVKLISKTVYTNLNMERPTFTSLHVSSFYS